jgi:PAS domain S-box-containing protein
MTFLRNLRIRFKLLGGYTLIFIVATLLGGTVIYYTVRSTIEANIERELTNSTATILNMVRTAAGTSIKNHLRAVAEKNKEIIQRIYADYEQGLISEKTAKELSKKILFSQTIGKTGYIFCVNTQGIAVVHPNPGVMGKNFMDHGFVRDMIRLKQGYLEYDWKNPEDENKRPKALYMAYFEPWDWIIGVSSYREEFKALIEISDFKESILSLKFGKTGYAYIMDSKGNLIVHPFLTGNYYNSKDKYGNYFVKKISELKTGKLVYFWKNPQETAEREKLVIFNYLPEYDWIVASASYLDEIYAPLKTIRQIILITVFLIIALVFITSFWVNNTVITPLKFLMNQLSIGASGNLAIRMPVKSTDEIGELADYFNEFMEKLEEYSTSLKSEIRQHHKTEKALRISEEKYRTILERMEEGYFEVDFSGRFTFFNISMEKILGAPKDFISGKKIYDFMNEENTKKLSTLFNKIKETGIAVQISDLELIKYTGTTCSIETSVSLLYDSYQSAIGFSGVLRDVSNRKKSEKALQLSEEMFSKAFRSSPSGMFIAAMKDTKILKANDSFLKISGYSHSQLIGRELAAFKFFSNASEGRKVLQGVLRKNRLESLEFKFLNSKGEKRTGVTSAEVVDVGGKKCMLVAMEDITEARQLESEILHISEKERQKIAMELHDDLCPQLIGIEVLTKILKRKLETKAIDETKDAETIRTLILDSIDKTRRLSRGLFPVNLSEHGLDTSLKELAGYVCDIFAISCTFTCNFSHPFKDGSVAVHLYYIAHEAVHNAVKHAKANKINIILTDNDEKIILTIKDNGKGLNNTTQSMGLGMKIMKYRATRIGALLDIIEDADKGTHVVIELDKGLQV